MNYLTPPVIEEITLRMESGARIIIPRAYIVEAVVSMEAPSHRGLGLLDRYERSVYELTLRLRMDRLTWHMHPEEEEVAMGEIVERGVSELPAAQKKLPTEV